MTSMTILIVDDQAFIRQTLAKALGGTGLYKVLQAADGMEAIKLMRGTTDKIEIAGGTDLLAAPPPAEAKIDCIISDISMLPMNGLEFVKAIRVGLGGTARNTPVIMLTGHAEKQLLAAAIALDVSGFVVKPVSGKLIRERIERAMVTPVNVKPAVDYAALIIPDIDAADQWAASAALKAPVTPVRAADLLDGIEVSHQIPPSELKVGDRLSENLTTEEGVLVVTEGTVVVPGLITALTDLSAIVKLRDRIAVVRKNS